MSAALILGLVGGLLVVAFLANRVFGLTRIPDVLVLMMLGVLLGPVLGLVQAGTLAKTTNLLGTLAIILVLFEGGLELDLRDTLKHFPGSFLLATLAYVFSTVLVAVIVAKGLGLSWTDGLLVGAVLGCTSSTVVLPVLQQLQAEEPVRVTLMLEASWGDVLAVLTVGLLLGMRSQGGAVAQGLAHGLLKQVGIALLFTIPAGVLWSRLLHVLSEQRFWQVLTFSIVLVLYAGMEALGRQRPDCGAGLWPDAVKFSRRRSRPGTDLAGRANGGVAAGLAHLPLRAGLPGAHFLLCDDWRGGGAGHFSRASTAHGRDAGIFVSGALAGDSFQPLGVAGNRGAQPGIDFLGHAPRTDHGGPGHRSGRSSGEAGWHLSRDWRLPSF